MILDIVDVKYHLLIKIMLPGVVAIVGRPNVGKSSLFNRLLGKRKSIVDPAPGVTRDRIYAEITWRGKKIKLIDTGGIDLETKNRIKRQVLRQVEVAIEEAELIAMVGDVTSGVAAFDQEIASIIRGQNKKAILVVNKVDNVRLESQVNEFFSLGMGAPHPVSALHGLGIGEFLDEIARNVSAAKEEDFSGLKIAIVGRPNVGKSSYLNALLQEERVVVDDEPGTTRDAIDTILLKDGKEILLIDTAGIKHKSKLRENLEFYSILRSQEAVKRADVCLLLIDAYQGIVVDDIRILNYVWDQLKPLVLVVNKWDLIDNLNPEKYEKLLKERVHLAHSLPISFCSSLNKENILSPIDLAQELYEKLNTKIPTARLNEFLRALLDRHPPPSVSGRRPKFFYITQVKSGPPIFKVFVNEPRRVKASYNNYLENDIRLKFGLKGIPLKLLYQARKEG